MQIDRCSGRDFGREDGRLPLGPVGASSCQPRSHLSRVTTILDGPEKIPDGGKDHWPHREFGRLAAVVAFSGHTGRGLPGLPEKNCRDLKSESHL